MHSDESRDLELTKRQLVAKAIADPYALYDQYVALIENSKGKATGGTADLKRRVSEAHAALQGVKAENQELREKLEALRKSRTMQVGKFVASPARWAKNRKKSVKRIGRTSLQQIKRGVQHRPGVKDFVTKKPGARNLAVEIQQTSKENSGHTREVFDFSSTPLGEFSAKENKKNFEKALNYLWYNEGSISRSFDFIEENPRWSDSKDSSDKLKTLVTRVQNAYQLKKFGVTLPSRSQGAAYIPEPDRIMYCVHSTPVFNSNGYSTRTKGVAQGLLEAGGDVITVARAGYPWDSRVDRSKPKPTRFESKIDSVLYIHNPGPNLNRDGLNGYFAEAADSFVREARRLRPSIIQSASNYRTAIPALIAARRVGVPFVYEVRGLWEITEASAKPGFENSERFTLMKDLETFVAVEADQVLAITEEVAEELVKRGVDRTKIEIAPNGVSPDNFIAIPKDVKYAEAKKIDPSKVTIGFAGSFVEYEGLDLLLQASALLRGKGVDHQVVLAGSGEADQRLRGLNRQLGNNNVFFLGRLPQNQMTRLMSTFDIVACPRKSTLITEMVSPLKPLESFSAGIATVLSDVSPSHKLAGKSSTAQRAMLFPAGDAQALADSLEQLIKDEDLRRDLGRTARLWVVRERSWKKIGKKMLESHRTACDFYEKAVDSGPLLSDLKVGVIADEFTRTSLQATFDVLLMDRSSWSDQLQREKLDFLFVESAWEGNGGEWHRGVGYYGDKENADLFQLLEACRKMGIPTVFWNKEDPVHFARFAPTAAHFDHVFTTDAKMIAKYRDLQGSRNQTISSHSFYAQPHLHNPLPSAQPFSPSVAYAGTYYGDRYADRSARLDSLLDAAFSYGLELYDRQADNPDSPYKFPLKYRDFVRGALPYRDIIETYPSHLVHLNVNSVEDSPSMFSRRVVEIPACGGVLISAEGRGISETFGSVLATSNDPRVYEAWLYDWSNNPTSWFDERWRQMRAIYRAHTSMAALTILARTIGISTKNPGLPTYGLRVPTLDMQVATQILGYSFRPKVVITERGEEEAEARLRQAGITVGSKNGVQSLQLDWIGSFHFEATRTYYEDLLTATFYGEWSFLDATSRQIDSLEAPIAEPTFEKPGPFALRPYAEKLSEKKERGLRFLFPLMQELDTEDKNFRTELGVNLKKKNILIAGHDLKFIASFIKYLQELGHEVETDVWESHSKHDEEESEKKLARADVVIAEWGLGNAVWYSRHIKPHQRLIVRVHSQELFRPYLSQINHALVDDFVFVGELIRKSAIYSHGIPHEKTIVIPNGVEVEKLDLSKDPDVHHTLGIVGIVPRSKRFDLALDLLEKLILHDSRYKLRIKGKLPNDYPWMQNRPEELEYYARQLKRVEELNLKVPGTVVFDGFDSAMPEWYQKIGIAISTSDFESFHFTLPDGAASGAQPVSLNWPGADLIYPETWLAGSVDQMAALILSGTAGRTQEEQDRQWVLDSFDVERIFDELHQLLMLED